MSNLLPVPYKVNLGQMAKTEYRVQIKDADGQQFAVISVPSNQMVKALCTAHLFAAAPEMAGVLMGLLTVLPPEVKSHISGHIEHAEAVLKKAMVQ